MRRSSKLNLLFLAIIGSTPLLFTSQVQAVCLPATYGIAISPATNNGNGFGVPMRDVDPSMGCTGIKTVDTLEGGAKDLIEQIKDDIREAGREVKQQMADNSAAEIKSMTSNNEQVVKTIVETTNAQIKDHLEMTRAFLDMEMDYMSEIKEREVRARSAPMDLDDTAEEVKFILNELDKSGKTHAQETIADMQKEYGKGTIIPVRIKAGENGVTATGQTCPEYDPNVHTTVEGCFYGHKAFPADKVAKYFKECSREKRRIVSSAKKSAVQQTVANQMLKSQNKFLDFTTDLKDSQLNAKIRVQSDFSCNPKELNKKYCLKELTKETYIQKVIANEIVPNGNISSANMFKPTPVGTIDGEFTQGLTDEELKAINLGSVERTSTEASGTEVAVSDNTVPIVYTYRTSSQYVAARDFVDNILSKELIPNQTIEQRKSSSSAIYQSRFLSRAAALSIAEYSMNKSIESRIGKKLREEIDKGTNFNPYLEVDGSKGKVIKEDINGAGYLDELADSINKDYQKIVVDATNQISGNSTSESLSVMAPEKAKEWQLEALIKQNELVLEQYSQGERIEMLLAAILSQVSNSPENIKYLEDLRRQ